MGVWEASTGVEIHRLAIPDVVFAAYSRDGTHFLAVRAKHNADPLALFFDAAGNLHKEFGLDQASDAISFDTQRMVFAGGDGSLSIWDTSTGKLLERRSGMKITAVPLLRWAVLGCVALVWTGMWWTARPKPQVDSPDRPPPPADYGWGLVGVLAAFELATGLLMLVAGAILAWLALIAAQVAFLALLLVSLFWLRVNLPALLFTIATLIATSAHLWSVLISHLPP